MKMNAFITGYYKNGSHFEYHVFTLADFTRVVAALIREDVHVAIVTDYDEEDNAVSYTQLI